MLRFALPLLLALVLAGPASSAVKPKPFMWTPAQAKARVSAENPAVLGREEGTITATRCVGLTKAAKGTFTAFRCSAAFKPSRLSSTAPPTMTLYVKVRKQGKGQVCASTTSLAAIPAACTNPAGTRATGTRDDAKTELRKFIGGPGGLYQGQTDCTGWGAGFYTCFFGAGEDSPTAGHGIVVFGPTVRVTVLNSPA